MARKNALRLESFNPIETRNTNSNTGFAFYRSGCILQSNVQNFNSGDSKMMITQKAKIWMAFWKDFLLKLGELQLQNSVKNQLIL